MEEVFGSIKRRYQKEVFKLLREFSRIGKEGSKGRKGFGNSLLRNWLLKILGGFPTHNGRELGPFWDFRIRNLLLVPLTKRLKLRPFKEGRGLIPGIFPFKIFLKKGVPNWFYFHLGWHPKGSLLRIWGRKPRV